MAEPGRSCRSPWPRRSHGRAWDLVAGAVVAVDAVHPLGRVGREEPVDVRLDIRRVAGLEDREEFLRGPISGLDGDVFDRLRLRIGARELHVRFDVPVDAAGRRGAPEARWPEDEGHRIPGVGRVGSEARVEHQLDGTAVRHERIDVVAPPAGGARWREVAVTRRRDRGREVAGDQLEELLGAVDLRLDPAGETRLDVALGAGELAMRRDLVRLQLRAHRVAATAEVGSLRPADGGDTADREKGAETCKKEQRDQPAAAAVEREPRQAASDAEPRRSGLRCRRRNRRNVAGGRLAAVRGRGGSAGDGPGHRRLGRDAHRTSSSRVASIVSESSVPTLIWRSTPALSMKKCDGMPRIRYSAARLVSGSGTLM